ncbi:MAG: cytochrome c oxidase assembly protein [Gemmatimonadota bacterium]
MQWWCSAQTVAWDWSWQMYPGVWAFVSLLGIAYWVLLRRLGARAREGALWESRLRRATYFAGLLCLWVALDWPIGPLGAGYLASAHMVQFLLIALVAPPLLLYGLPSGAFERLANRPAVLGFLRVVTHPLVALAFFNVTLIATHWPSVVDSMMGSQLGSFLLDMAWWVAGLVLWWPVVAPVPARPGFAYLYKIGYLILATIVNTPVFALLTFSGLPLYATYELSPPIQGISPRVDQQLAGLIMKIGGGLIFWAAITVLFYRWYRAEHAAGEA